MRSTHSLSYTHTTTHSQEEYDVLLNKLRFASAHQSELHTHEAHEVAATAAASTPMPTSMQQQQNAQQQQQKQHAAQQQQHA